MQIIKTPEIHRQIKESQTSIILTLSWVRLSSLLWRKEVNLKNHSKNFVKEIMIPIFVKIKYFKPTTRITMLRIKSRRQSHPRISWGLSFVKEQKYKKTFIIDMTNSLFIYYLWLYLRKVNIWSTFMYYTFLTLILLTWWRMSFRKKCKVYRFVYVKIH